MKDIHVKTEKVDTNVNTPQYDEEIPDEEKKENLKKLVELTQSYRNYCDGKSKVLPKIEEIIVEKNLTVCKCCAMKDVFDSLHVKDKIPYCVVFPRPEFEGEEGEKVKIMFISRDPNFKSPEECKKKKVRWPSGHTYEEESLIYYVQSNYPLNVFTYLLMRKKNITDVTEFFGLLLGKKNYEWNKYMKEVVWNGNKEVAKKSFIYWTHLIKCYTGNWGKIYNNSQQSQNKNKFNKEKAKVIIRSCSQLLKYEILQLKPNIIIGVGDEVKNALCSIGILDLKFKEEFSEVLKELIINFVQGNSNTIVIPHPSGANASYKYYYSEMRLQLTKNKKIIEEFENVINRIGEIL